ncbi:hypothetical protein GQ53DRAFT_799147 [Thozetella sp. PMI_491]|nr:hypothetical protein GQ53DRAFT_799147 [Thozetella sp. PMI_491]
MPGVISRPTRAARGKLGRPSKPATASITSFARVSKVQTTADKEAMQKAAAIETPKTTIEIVLFSSKKRKAGEEDEKTSAASHASTKKLRREAELTTTSAPSPKLRRKKTVTFALPEDAPLVPASSSTTSSKRKRSSDSECTPPTESSEVEQPEALFERLNLQSSPIRKRTKTSTLRSKFEADLNLPQDLLDLLDLHLAFLRTLSLHHVQNGPTVPVDLNELCPRITQTWGKRRVTVDDVQRCVGILGRAQDSRVKSAAPYFLFELGQRKICLELHNPTMGPLREPKLNMDFEANLRALWAARRDTDMKAFIKSLPMAPIKTCPKPSPLLSKGKRALEELKNGVVRKREEKSTQAQAIPTLNADGTKMSVLDRIRFKELLQAQAGQGPTPEELQRRAALQRVGDVAAVIGMLAKATSTGQARVSFTMAVVLSKLKDSIRVPVSPEEAGACVKILASDVAPQWLRIVTIGGREHVVVQTAAEPSKMALEERARALCA